ncbi:MAG: pilus assembly protein PilM [Thiohalophilus sp.]|uniref:pilus assembly protein PilM n=1 Tax=Thiohalophilus sp. TaxID=3028392 RepID=UPI0028706670|nr:pilus assembly protein PilM [Thiohalophilus sp.]MDR9435454.1 pilus assembly protein PilM [Thiohalophilus sp.]
MHLSDQGIAVAAVRYQAQQPVLVACEFMAAGPAERAQVLTKVLGTDGLNGMRVSTVLNHGEFDLQMIEAPEVAEDELQAAVRWRIKDRLEFDINEAVLDVFTIPGQQERGRRPMVYVVAARQERVKQYIDELEGAGADLCCVDIPELAQRNLAVRLPEDARGVAMLSLGPDSGLLTLTREGAIYLARELDVGYRMLESATATADGDSGLQLEADISPDQQRAFDTIVLEVQRSLDYFESHFGLPPIGHLALAPTPTPLPEMLEYMGSNLGVQIKPLELGELLEADALPDRRIQAETLLAIGAALRGPGT